jgi:hypothetical protein
MVAAARRAEPQHGLPPRELGAARGANHRHHPVNSSSSTARGQRSEKPTTRPTSPPLRPASAGLSLALPLSRLGVIGPPLWARKSQPILEDGEGAPILCQRLDGIDVQVGGVPVTL